MAQSSFIPKSVLRVEALAWAVVTHSTLEATWFAQMRNASAQKTVDMSFGKWDVEFLSADSSHAKSRSGRLAGGLSFNVLIDFDQGSSCVFNSWSFSDGETEIVEYGGTLIKTGARLKAVEKISARYISTVMFRFEIRLLNSKASR